MLPLTLTLNGSLVDLPADAEVALSYRANDLRRLDSREATFSETFTLPLTARNRRVLERAHALDSYTHLPYQPLPAVLSQGGTVVLDGFGILEHSAEGYDLTLTDAAGTLFAVVGNRSLRELDLRFYDHELSYHNVAAADANDYTQGYTYALADTGLLAQRPAGQGLTYDELPASVFVHALLLAMLADPLPPVPRPDEYQPPDNPLAGYRLTGSLLQEVVYQNLVLPRAMAYPQLRAATLYPFTVKAAYAEPVTLTSANGGVLLFPALLAGEPALWQQGQYTPPQFPVGVHVEVRLPLVHQGLEGQFILSLYNPSTNALTDIYYHDALTPDSGRSVVAFDYTIPLLNAQPGDRLVVRVPIVNSATSITIEAGASISLTPLPRAWPGAPVHLEAGLPDMGQDELLKLLFNQFNVVCQVDPVFKLIRLDLFNDLEKNRDKAVDWSGKIDWQQRPRLDYVLDTYAQRNALAYAQAPKAYEQQLALRPAPYDDLATGRGLLRCSNTTLPATADAYTSSLLLPLPHATLAGRQALAWLPFFAPADLSKKVNVWDAQHAYSEGDLVLYQGVSFRCTVGDHKTTTAVPNWADVRPVNGRGDQPWQAVDDFFPVSSDELGSVALLAPYPGGVQIKDTGTGDSGTGGRLFYNPSRQLSRQGLSFDELLPLYYPGLAAILGRVQVLNLDMRLNSFDLANLDFTIPVKVNVVHAQGYGQLSAYLYLNEISQHQPGQAGATACSFLVLGNPIAGLAPLVPPPVVVTRKAFETEDETYFILSEDGMLLLLEY